jgi:ATP-dependent Clp protease protease subunit
LSDKHELAPALVVGGRAKSGGTFLDQIEASLAELRVVNMVGTVDPHMAYELAMRMRYLASQNHKPISLYLNTPGGSIVDGLAIFDLLKSIQTEGKTPIDIVATGSCMSMGMIILQAARTRKATKHTHFLLHELRTAQEGNLGALRDTQVHLEKLQATLNSIIAERTGQDVKKLFKLFERREFYINVEDALKYHLIDEVA